MRERVKTDKFDERKHLFNIRHNLIETGKSYSSESYVVHNPDPYIEIDINKYSGGLYIICGICDFSLPIFDFDID